MPDRSLAELAAEITAGAVRLAAATAAWLHLIAEFDQREGWAGHGIASCAHWLAWQCGLAPGTAREHVRVARALDSLPLIDAAFVTGRLSYSKVRALTRVADEHCEADLLDFALHATASQVERTVRQWHRAEALDAASATDHQEFDWFWDETGMLVVRARLTPEDGAAFVAGLESHAERTARRERAAATKARREGDAASASHETDDRAADEDDAVAHARERTTARRCAALVALATAVAAADRRPGDPPRREVVLHLDATTVAADTAAGRAWLDGGPALSRPQALRLACDATAVVMLEDGGEPLALSRRRRRATRGQRRALLHRDGGCARPGCAETRIERLHAHHLRHWLFGGRTDLTNLVLLCDRDHGAVHDLDLILTRRNGRLIALTPDGRRVWGPADTAFTAGLAGLIAPTSRDGQFGRLRASDGDDGCEEWFAGVHPLDQRRARRPATGTGAAARQHTSIPAAEGDADSIGALLYPAGEPDLPDALSVTGERMDMNYVVGVLMTNRDLSRRLAAQNGIALAA
jgi:Domain of unknown function (DUF222)/HNH endonuclease